MGTERVLSLKAGDIEIEIVDVQKLPKSYPAIPQAALESNIITAYLYGRAAHRKDNRRRFKTYYYNLVGPELSYGQICKLKFCLCIVQMLHGVFENSSLSLEYIKERLVKEFNWYKMPIDKCEIREQKSEK